MDTKDNLWVTCPLIADEVKPGFDISVVVDVFNGKKLGTKDRVGCYLYALGRFGTIVSSDGAVTSNSGNTQLYLYVSSVRYEYPVSYKLLCSLSAKSQVVSFTLREYGNTNSD